MKPNPLDLFFDFIFGVLAALVVLFFLSWAWEKEYGDCAVGEIRNDLGECHP